MLSLKTNRYFATLLLAVMASGATAGIHLTGRTITTRDGLPSNQVYDMEQDADGYIWMGMSNGLYRYDGYHFAPISHEAVGTIWQDKDNDLMWTRSATFVYNCYDFREGRFVDYTGTCDPHKTYQKFTTEENGIWMYDPYAIRHVTYHSSGRDGKRTFVCRDFDKETASPNGSRIIRLVPDGQGCAWVLTDNGLLRIEADGRIKTVIKEGYMKMGHRWKDRCFILTQGNHIIVFDQKGRRIKELSMPEAFGDINNVNGNIIWQDKWVIVARTKVITMDCRDYTFDMPQDMQMEFGIPLNDIDGNHWISDKDGILHLFPREGKPKRFRLLRDTGYSLAKRRRFSIAEGSDGKAYIATFGNGLYIYNPQNELLEHYTASDSQPVITSNYLTDIMADRDGNIWISQEETGLVFLSKKWLPEALHFHPEPGQPGGIDNYISSLSPESNGTVHISTRSRKRYLLDPKTGSLQPSGMASYDNIRLDSITDRYGRQWVATWEMGLLMKEPLPDGSYRQHAYLDRSITESRINAITLGKDGQLWVATYHGVYAIDTREKTVENNLFRHYGTNEGLPSNNISCLLIAGDIMWIGTQSSGLARCRFLDTGAIDIQVLSTKHGLVNNNIHSLVADDNGHIWAGVDDAVTCINPKTMAVTNYQFATTMLNNLYSDGCAIRLNDGRLLFGTHDGLTLITPANTDVDEQGVRHKERRAAQVTNIEINGTSIYDEEGVFNVSFYEKDITFAHNENSLTLFFSCFDYAHQQQTMYQFWLEGIDKGWREPSTQNSVDYGNLPPGKYIFHLRTAEDSEETTLAIIIRQPWYNTWWAWTIYLIILGAIGWLFYSNWRERFMLHQQMKVEKQVMEFRANFFTQVAHEFRTPLAIITGAVDKLGEDRQSQKKPMQTAKRGVRRLTLLVNQLMEFRKINTGNLRLQVEPGEIIGFVRDIYQDFWSAAQQKELSVSFTSFEKKFLMPFDRHIIDTITYNLFSNAIKYTPQGGSLVLRIKLEDDMLKIIVEDSGPGIDEKQRGQLFQPFMRGYASQGGMGIGLYTAYRMAQTHKGSLTYEQSESLGGSKFTLSIPADESNYGTDEYRTVSALEKVKDDDKQTEVILEMLPNALNDLEIAIIEDDTDMLEQIKAEVGVYFKVSGYTSGERGFESMKLTKPSLLICDVMLPDTNGYEIVKRMKADEELKDIPVIMLTALGDEDHQIKGYKAGADDYMVKPCNYRVLIARAIQMIKWNEERETVRDDAGEVVETRETGDASEHAQSTTIITSTADKRFLEKLNTIVDQHISDENFSIDQMAEFMKTGRTKLYGKVKELTGMSPNKLMTDRRMRLAARLLEDGELNITEISYRVGISDASYFNKCFKRYYGMAPGKYKKEK